MKILVSSLEASANLHLKEVLTHLNNVQICGIFDKRFGDALWGLLKFCH